MKEKDKSNLSMLEVCRKGSYSFTRTNVIKISRFCKTVSTSLENPYSYGIDEPYFLSITEINSTGYSHKYDTILEYGELKIELPYKYSGIDNRFIFEPEIFIPMGTIFYFKINKKSVPEDIPIPRLNAQIYGNIHYVQKEDLL